MLQIPELPVQWAIALIVTIAAFGAWGVTQVMKLTLNGWVQAVHGTEPWWFSGAVRALSLIVGAVTGLAITGEALGAGLGFAAGGGMTLIVWVIKKRAKKLAGTDENPETIQIAAINPKDDE